MSTPIRRSLVVLTLILLPCLLLGRVVFGGEVFLPADLLQLFAPWNASGTNGSVNHPAWNPILWDGIAEFYPWRLFAATSLQAGYLPLWNPHQFCGAPFVANAQSAIFYPPNLIFWTLPVKYAFGVSVVLHLAMTGLFLYGFLRRPLGLTRPGAMLGAVTWQLSAWQVAWLALPTFLCVSAWLPASLWSVHRMVQRPEPRRAVVLGVVMAVLLLAGHFQVALYCLLFTAAYGFCFALSCRSDHSVKFLRLLACCLTACLITGGLAAPQLLPSIELSHLSHRAAATANWTSFQAYLLHGGMPFYHLMSLFCPFFFGSPTDGSYFGATNFAENACYVGITALFLAVFAVWTIRRTTPLITFFAVAALASMLLALGTPLNALLYFGIPGFSQSGSPDRILVLWTFCIAVLAGFGTDAIVRQGLNRRLASLARPSISYFVLIALIAGGSAYMLASRIADPSHVVEIFWQGGNPWRIPAALLLVTALALGYYSIDRMPVSRIGPLLVLLCAADLLSSGINYNLTSPPSQVYPSSPAIAYLQQHADHNRIMPLNRTWSITDPPHAVLPPNAGTVFGFSDTQGYDSLFPGRYKAFADLLNSGDSSPEANGNMVFTHEYESSLASAAAARYFVSESALPDQPGISLASQADSLWIYSNDNAQSRARLANGGNVTWLRDEPTRVTVIAAQTGGENTLTLADEWYPGWRAWVNGLPEPIQLDNNAFRSIHWTDAPKEAGGTAKVEMRYLPTTLLLGLYLACIAIAAAVGILVRPIIWSAWRSPESHPPGSGTH